MTKHEAMEYALGYAAGREDASNVKTVAPGGETGFIAFARAYAQAWDEYNNDRRGFMPPARAAYAAWQASKGMTIFGS